MSCTCNIINRVTNDILVRCKLLVSVNFSVSCSTIDDPVHIETFACKGCVHWRHAVVFLTGKGLGLHYKQDVSAPLLQ